MGHFELRNVAETCNGIPYAEYVDNLVLNAASEDEAIEETKLLQEAHDADYIAINGMVLMTDKLPTYLDCLYFVDGQTGEITKVITD